MSSRDLIFTTHAKERMRLRSVTTDMVAATLAHPELTSPTDKPDVMKFVRHLNQRRIEVIATYLTNRRAWLIVSVWVRGEEDPTPWAWQLITAPFRLAWWILRQLSGGGRKK